MCQKNKIREYCALARRMMDSGRVVAIAETHTKKCGRLIAKRLIESGTVKQFFMELPTSEGGVAEYGGMPFEPFNETFKDILGNKKKLENLDSLFRIIVKSDASPTLEELAKLAIENRVQVIAVDPLARLGIGDKNIELRNAAAANYITRHMSAAGGGL